MGILIQTAVNKIMLNTCKKRADSDSYNENYRKYNIIDRLNRFTNKNCYKCAESISEIVA